MPYFACNVILKKKIRVLLKLHGLFLHVFAIRNPKFSAVSTTTHASNEAINYETHPLACTTFNLIYQKAHLLFDTH